MVAILGANSVSGGGYEIDNSLRFNDADSAELTRTPGSEGDKQIHTISMWIKRCTSGTNQALFSAGPSDSSVYSIRFIDDTLYISQSSGFVKNTNRLFRDPSAWYHIVVAIDTTDGTQNDRIKVYINGVLETSFAENSFAGGQNFNTNVNDDVLHAVGYDTLNNAVPFDGYISEFHLIDGTQKAASDFGEFNDNGVWIPKAYEGTYGTNGFYLEFKETGTGQNSSGMGADTSGNDNHFAVTNLAATDVTTDTPTNNFATMNPLHSEGMTFSEGNLDILAATGNWNVALGTIAIPNSGKWYMEVKITAVQAAGHNTIGFLDSNYPFGSNDTATGFTGGGGSWLTYVYFHAVNDNAYVNSADGTAYQFENNTTFNGSVNDILMMAFDRDNDKVWFGKNDAWAKANGTTGANPSTGADATIVSVQENSARTYMPMSANGNSSARQQWNFGNPPYTISSGNADANGYGNFEYAVPTGFYSLCTKNLAEFG